MEEAEGSTVLLLLLVVVVVVVVVAATTEDEARGGSSGCFSFLGAGARAASSDLFVLLTSWLLLIETLLVVAVGVVTTAVTVAVMRPAVPAVVLWLLVVEMDSDVTEGLVEVALVLLLLLDLFLRGGVPIFFLKKFPARCMAFLGFFWLFLLLLEEESVPAVVRFLL